MSVWLAGARLRLHVPPTDVAGYGGGGEGPGPASDSAAAPPRPAPRAPTRLEDNLGNPFTPYMYAISVLHCLTVSLAEGGAGLGTAWGEQTARRLLAEAGFGAVEVFDAPGPQNSIFVCRLPAPVR